jgi:HlyD family type I secretion membrane fusion protein
MKVLDILTKADDPTRVGYALIGVTFGLFGGWAAIAPLQRAVVSQGSVVIEESRKSIQHFEGGVVAGILAAEGKTVGKGDLLMRLSPIQAQANLDIVQSQLHNELALAARLSAEIRQADHIEFPIEMELRSENSWARKAMQDQETQFRERAASLVLQQRLLQARIEQLNAEVIGLAADRTSAARQLTLINEELVGLRDLRTRGLATVTRVLTLERERAQFDGKIARAAADSAKLAASLDEARAQLSQLRQKFQEDAASALTDSRRRSTELQERVAMAQDVLSRMEIFSPAAGAVQNLKVATIGQVIKPGEALMEVVPSGTSLVIHVHLPVVEIEHVAVGQRAEIKFPGFHSRRLPLFEGTLRSISRDRLVEDRSQQPYFLGIVTIDAEGIPEEFRTRLIAGMPADVLIVTGQRTALSYLVAPLTDSLWAGFKN